MVGAADPLQTQAGVERMCGKVGPWDMVQHVVVDVAVVVEDVDVVCFPVDLFQCSRNQAGNYLPWLKDLGPIDWARNKSYINLQ